MLKKLFILTLALSIGLTMQAGNDKSISKLIRSELEIPAALKKEKLNENVKVEFNLTENGKANVINVATGNAELKQYITNTFPKLDFQSTSLKKGTVYFVDINFRVL